MSPVEAIASARTSSDGREVVLENSLVRRVFRATPNGATVALDNLVTGQSLLRAVKPEATLTIGDKLYRVGGLTGQPDKAFLLPQWLDNMKGDPESFQLIGHSTGQPQEPLGWKKTRPSWNLPWPTPGVTLDFLYRGPDAATTGITVTVHYELYNGLPVMGKWLVISNQTAQPITLNKVQTEILAAVEAESAVDARPTNRWKLPPISVISDYSFGGMDPTTSSRITQWQMDPEYLTQVHYTRMTPCLLVAEPPVGPGMVIQPGTSLTTYRTYLVIHDSDDRERQGLALRRAMRRLAPWTTENPVMMHVRNADSKSFRLAVDQCAEVGFEMIIYTFGSGLEMENVNPEYMAKVKADVDYAHGKGIQVGAYSLLSSRSINPQTDVIDPKTGKPGGAVFGNAPCLGSEWATQYFQKLKLFIETTGLDLLEHDGPYPGDVCGSTTHPGHRVLEDSQWTQWKISTDFYRWCREHGVFVNAPDHYFLAGASKTAMGYREDNWSLPRAQQILHGRQNIYDGTWEKTPAMGWMFVPLTEYQGGGAAATLEPLRDHLADYEAHLANNFGAGVQACYRGPRLYDTDATRDLVKKWVSWFKQYRDILESDLIHVRRADGRDVDYYLHVNPTLKHRALVMVFNPLTESVQRNLDLPLYFSGLTQKATVSTEGNPGKEYTLDRNYHITVPVTIPSQSRTWLIIEE